jgi:hypothetical protein
MKRLLIIAAIAIAAAGCREYDIPVIYPPDRGDVYYPEVESTGMPARDARGNIIPDFSRVGYRWGDEAIPEVPVRETLEAPSNGSDARSMIQQAIDRVAAMPLVGRHRGAILLKRGIYNVSGTLTVSANGIVIRGEGTSGEDGTVLVATTTTKESDLIQITGAAFNWPAPPSNMNIKDEYVPVGRFWVTVDNAGSFAPGNKVILYRPPSAEWLADIRMDRIPEASDGTTAQWVPEDYFIRQERVVTMIKGDTLHFENPCVMALDARYGGGAVYKANITRVQECGVENLLLRSNYAGDEDENHAWTGVAISRAEHCWVRNVHSEYFAFGLVSMSESAKNITVASCECREPKSKVTGSRRYSYSLNGSLCLVIDCKAVHGRHDYVTGARNAGPNAFVNCVSEQALAENGPHQRWNSGTLYDNIITDGALNVYDHGNEGTGQGWAGVNQVLWNCTANRVICLNPWTSANNYSIGTMARKHGSKFVRPDGVWISLMQPVSPQSLYRAQFDLRRRESSGGVFQPAVR